MKGVSDIGRQDASGHRAVLDAAKAGPAGSRGAQACIGGNTFQPHAELGRRDPKVAGQ